MAWHPGDPMMARKVYPYVVRVYHKSVELIAEVLWATGPAHAARLAAYVANAHAREIVHPRDLDLSQVHFVTLPWADASSVVYDNPSVALSATVKS